MLRGELQLQEKTWIKIDGAEGGTRTPMGLLPLDPETNDGVFAN